MQYLIFNYTIALIFVSFFFYESVSSYFLYNSQRQRKLNNRSGLDLGIPSSCAFCPSPKYSISRSLSSSRSITTGKRIKNKSVESRYENLLTRHSTMDETGVSDINDDGDSSEEGIMNEGTQDDQFSNAVPPTPAMDRFEDLEGLSLDDLKIRLMEVVGGSGRNKLMTTSSKRAKVNEILLKLEAMNPTKKPSSSTLLNGVWDFLYTGGISPGLLGLQIALYASEKGNGAISLMDTYLTISRSQPRVEVTAKLNVFGRESTFNIQTNLELESDVRLFETYVSATLNDAFSIPFPKPGNNLPDPFRLFERSLFISYLDDDLLIVRDGFGAPDILTRKEMDFGSYTGEPSFSEDDLSPGAG